MRNHNKYAYEFAKEKPIELIEGTKVRIDMPPKE
jgi:hypothetical protein